MKEERLIIYDGYCNLCSCTVKWVSRNDPKGRFSFQPFPEQSTSRQGVVPSTMDGKVQSSPDTVVLLQGGKRYERSTAALRIAIGLRFPWPLLGILFIIPPFLRDGVYNLVARKRKTWFGERSICYLPEIRNFVHKS